ncbi:MAG: FG-GAP-like repeat-containing protein [Balneola sp.]
MNRITEYGIMVFKGYKKVTSLISLLWQTVTVGTMMFLLIGTPTTAWAQIDTNTFETKVDFTAGDQPWAMAIGDLDGDGKPDMAVANRVDNTVLLYLNTSSSGSISSGSFGTPSSISVGSGAPRGVDIYDIDGDGAKDLIVSNFDTNTLSVYRNTSSTGSISFATNVDLSATSGPWGMAFGDVDGDGKPDIAVANRGTTKISVFRNTSSVGSISFTTKSDFSTGSGPFNVALGDLDGDGKLDMVTGNRNDNDMSVHRNTSSVGSISFASKVDFTTAGNPAFAAIGDVDGDGKAEVLIANSGSSSISVYHNTASSGSITSSSFASKVDFSVGSSPTGIVVVDLDGDGKLDLGVNNANSDNISILRNTASSGSISSGSFATKVDFTAGDAPRKIEAADIDGDEGIDLVVVNSNSDNASVFRSTLGGDEEAPTVSSIAVSGSPVASATSVDFEVTFSESVTGVDISDFSVDGSGVTGTISAISGSGDTYTVTVSSVSGIGTLSIDLNSSGTSIEDGASNAIETGYTDGATHTVDTESPEVTSITVSGSPTETDVSIDFEVTFSESVTGVDISDFSFDVSGVTATISAISGSGTSYTVTINTVRGDGTLSIDLNDSGTGIEDGDTNAITDGFTDGGTHTVNTLPTASSVSFSGTLEEGETLTGSYTYSGGYAESGTTYQWYRSDDGAGTNKATISGATASTYVVTSAD